MFKLMIVLLAMVFTAQSSADNNKIKSEVFINEVNINEGVYKQARALQQVKPKLSQDISSSFVFDNKYSLGHDGHGGGAIRHLNNDSSTFYKLLDLAEGKYIKKSEFGPLKFVNKVISTLEWNKNGITLSAELAQNLRDRVNETNFYFADFSLVNKKSLKSNIVRDVIIENIAVSFNTEIMINLGKFNKMDKKSQNFLILHELLHHIKFLKISQNNRYSRYEELDEAKVRTLVRFLNIQSMNDELSKDSFQLKMAKNNMHLWVYDGDLEFQKKMIEKLWSSYEQMPESMLMYRVCLQISMNINIDWVDHYYDLNGLTEFVSIGAVVGGPGYNVRPPRRDLLVYIDSNLLKMFDINSYAYKIVEHVRKLVIKESNRQNLDPKGYSNKRN